MKNKFKISMIFFLIGILLLGILLGRLSSIISAASSMSKLSEGEYQIFVDSKVIDFLNERYSQQQEKLFCIDGSINDETKIININKIKEEIISNPSQFRVQSIDRYACATNLGDIHTHPKIYGIFPSCEFSIPDAYVLGEGFGKNNNRVAGVYCAEDKIAFYVSNNEIDDSIIIKNSKIGYIEVSE